MTKEGDQQKTIKKKQNYQTDNFNQHSHMMFFMKKLKWMGLIILK